MIIKKLSIIVPVYNEIRTLKKILVKLDRLSLGTIKKEVIVVDDGSKDGSTDLVRSVGKMHKPGWKVILQAKNYGKGAAIKSALQRATGDFVIIQDADEEYNPDEIRLLTDRATKDNLLMVFGSRDRDVKNQYLYPHFYWGSRLLCFLMNTAFGQKFTDPETCYKLIQTDALRFIDLTEKGFGIEIEMAAKLARMKLPFGEVGITYKPRTFAEGKKIGVRDGVRAIFLIAKYWISDLHYAVVDRILRFIRLQAALKYANINNNISLVDVGCGRQATLAWRMGRKIKSYTGLDIEVPNVRIGNAELVRVDLDGKFVRRGGFANLIIGTAIIEHLDNPDLFLTECRKMLSPTGQIIFTTPAPPFADMVLKLMVVVRTIRADEVFDHKNYFSLPELRQLLEKNGFTVVRAERFLFGLNNLIVGIKK